MLTKNSSPETLRQHIVQLQETITSLTITNTQLQEKFSRQGLVSTIIQAMRGTLVLEEVLQTTADRLHAALKVSQCLIFRPDFPNKMVVDQVSGATDEGHSLSGVSGDFFNYYHQHLTQGKPVVLHQIDPSLPLSIQASAGEYGLRSILIVPLIWKDSYIGGISLHQYDKQRQWTNDEITFVQEIADHCAIAIQQAEIYQQAQTELAKRQQTETTLQQTHEQLQAVLNAVPGFVSWVDSEGRYGGVNQKLAADFNLSPAAFVGQELGFKNTSPQFALFMRQFLASSALTASQVIEAQVKGERRDYLIVAQKYQQGDAAVSVGIDISDRVQAEAALQDSELKFRTLAETVPAAIYIYQDTKICYVNPATIAITSYTEQQLLTMNFWDIFPPNMQKLVRKRGLACQRGEKVPAKYEAKIITKNGEFRWVEMISKVIEFEGKLAVQGIAFDITTRKQAEKKLRKRQQKFEALTENSPDIIGRLDKNLCHIYLNQAVERATGISRQSFIGKNHSKLGLLEQQDIEWQKALERVFVTGQIEVSEFELTARNGVRYYHCRLVPEFAKDGSVESILTITRDITEQKQAEEQIKASLLEKEVLLKEIHHRVKNNLQVISSLLDLQSQQIQDLQILEIFQSSQNRIKSMALIHEKLYELPNLDRIEFADYIQHLTNYLFRTYAVHPDNITLHLDLQNISLNVNTAVPCGLIVNELVCNSLKHAFSDQKKGQVWVELKSEANQIYLIVRDDGIKSQSSMEKLPDKSLGMQLIKALVEQIKGEIEIDKSGGTAFKIRFVELDC